MTTKIGWFNKNKLGNSPKYESYRHSLASKGIKTARPKSPKGFSSSGVSTPNFDMVKKAVVVYKVGDIIRIKSQYRNVGENDYFMVLEVKGDRVDIQIIGSNLTFAPIETIPTEMITKVISKTDMVSGKTYEIITPEQYNRALRKQEKANLQELGSSLSWVSMKSKIYPLMKGSFIGDSGNVEKIKMRSDWREQIKKL